jgi:hypothetical protein
MMSSEGERWVEVATMIGQRINSTLKDVVPPEAQMHLLNAQRELLTALFLIYEHQAGARRPEPGPAAPRRRTRSAARSSRASRPASRVQHIEID